MALSIQFLPFFQVNTPTKTFGLGKVTFALYFSQYFNSIGQHPPSFFGSTYSGLFVCSILLIIVGCVLKLFGLARAMLCSECTKFSFFLLKFPHLFNSSYIQVFLELLDLITEGHSRDHSICPLFLRQNFVPESKKCFLNFSQ